MTDSDPPPAPAGYAYLTFNGAYVVSNSTYVIVKVS